MLTAATDDGSGDRRVEIGGSVNSSEVPTTLPTTLRVCGVGRAKG